MIFEKELNHWGKGLIGLELSNSKAHDEIIMIRTIETEAKAIIRDPVVLFPGMTKEKMIHIYKEYCATTCETIRDEKGNIIDLPNVSVSLIDDAINLAFLHA